MLIPALVSQAVCQNYYQFRTVKLRKSVTSEVTDGIICEILEMHDNDKVLSFYIQYY